MMTTTSSRTLVWVWFWTRCVLILGLAPFVWWDWFDNHYPDNAPHEPRTPATGGSD